MPPKRKEKEILKSPFKSIEIALPNGLPAVIEVEEDNQNDIAIQTALKEAVICEEVKPSFIKKNANVCMALSKCNTSEEVFQAVKNAFSILMSPVALNRTYALILRDKKNLFKENSLELKWIDLAIKSLEEHGFLHIKLKFIAKESKFWA